MSGTVFGNAQGTCTQRVLVVANETGISLKVQEIDFSNGEHKQEPHLSRQPFGKIPAYESDSGVKLFESRAIARYIDAKAGGKLAHRNDIDQAALVDTWCSVEQAYFDKHASVIVIELVFKKLFGKETDFEAVKRETAALSDVLDVYEKQLSTRSYLAGNSLSLADLFHLPIGEHLFRVQPEHLEKRPNLAKWWKTISALPSWQKTTTPSV